MGGERGESGEMIVLGGEFEDEIAVRLEEL